MKHIEEISYKDYGIDAIPVKNTGYFVESKPNSYHSNCGINMYCQEVNTMIKIKNNDDNYFDFSKNMLDIGSHCGTYSIVLDFGYYYMFDGNKEECVISEFNMLLHNKLNKCSVYNVLLSEKIENIEYDGYSTKNNIKDNIFENDKLEIIRTYTLDSFNFNNIGFIKIDVEGMEYKVLKGGLGTIIRNNYPPILFELWDVGYLGMTQEKHDKLQYFLENLGYKILWYWGDNETHLAIHI